MQTLKNVVTGLCSIALVLAPVAAPLAGVVAEEPWEVVPEDSLRDLRGGMDLGDLVANFAIQRVVEIDGVVVARMQLVISNLDRLANGGMPTITVTGPMAEIVQFMKTAGNVSVAGTNVNVPSNVASLPAASGSQTGPSVPAAPVAAVSAAQSTAAAAARAAASTAASVAPTVASSGNAGTVSATGTQSGSMTQMGSALANAVTAAANATALPSPSTSGAAATASPSTASSVANTPASVANTPVSVANTPARIASTTTSAANAAATAVSNTHLQASATPQANAQPVSTSAAPANSTRIIPVGTTGQAVVLSNLPNAAALTTAVQNEVHAATIQTQTTISATINSIPSLNAISLGNSIRAQMSGGG